MPRAPRLSSLRLDDTGDELLKRRAEPLISQLKQRRLWQGANRIADAREREINIKRTCSPGRRKLSLNRDLSVFCLDIAPATKIL
jgi:hypothetical protein